jgi:hypothetical protein
MKNVLLLLTILGIFVSCGTPEGKTKAKFNLGFAVGPFSSGGLMVFGKKEDSPGIYFSKRILSSADTVELLNGVWSFKTVAWDGLDYMEGNVKCSGAENVSLNGSNTDVVLNFTKRECQDGDVFGAIVSQGQVGQFNPLTLVTCNNHRAVQINDSEKIAENCVRGGTKSFEIIIPEFDEGGALSIGTGLKSACQDYSNTASQVHDTNLRVPMFNDPQAPLTMFIVSYPELGCVGAPEIVNARQEHGVRFNLDFYQNKNMVTIQSEYCQGNNLANLVTSNTFDFRGGTWHMICHPTHFNTAFGSNQNLKYALGANLDFAGADFSNLYTIGTGGELYGNGKTLSNIVHNFSGTPSMRGGIFQSINGDIRDLRVQDVTMDVDYNNADSSGLGVLFGSKGANAAIEIENVELKNVHLDIRNTGSTVNVERVGLLGGLFDTSAEVKNIRVIDSSVTLDGSAGNEIREVGGVFGRFSGNIKGVEVTNFQVYSETGNSLAKSQSIGSVIGRTATNLDMRDVEVRALNFAIDHPAQAIGGVVGTLAEANAFTGIFAQGVISLTENAATHPDIGGIAGIVTHGGTFNGELLNSHVDINARNAAGGAGPVGGIFGKTSGTPSNLRMARYEGNITGKTSCGGLIGTDTSGGQIDYGFSVGIVDCAGGAVGGIIADGQTSTVSHVTSIMNVINGASSGGGGLVGRFNAASGTLSESYFGGALNGTTAMTAGYDGLLVGRCDGCTVQNSYTDVGDASETAVGSGYTPGTANCALVTNGGTNQCTAFATLALLTSGYATGNLTHINWDSSGAKHQLKSEKFFHRYIDVVGNKTKPFGIGGIADWNLFGNLQLVEPSFQFKGASYILLGDLDFQNDSSKIVPWKGFSGHLMGNNMTIRNVSFSESGTDALGMIRSLHDGARIEHHDPYSGPKKLYLKSINFTQNAAYSAGALAGGASLGATGKVIIKDVEVWDSNLQANYNTGGLVGHLASSGADSFEVSNIRVRNTQVVGGANHGTGGAIGRVEMSTATGKTLFNILVDGQSSVTESTTQTHIGGIFGKSNTVGGAALISYARVDGNNFVGGIGGQITASNFQYLHADNDSSNCGGANCGGLFGDTIGTSTIGRSTNHMHINASAAGIVGTMAGTTITNVISEDGNSYDSTSAIQSTSVSCFADPTAFCQSFTLDSERFYWEENSLPKLRWIEQIQKSFP